MPLGFMQVLGNLCVGAVCKGLEQERMQDGPRTRCTGST